MLAFFVGVIVAQEQDRFARHDVELHSSCDISRRAFIAGLLGTLGCAGAASLSGCALPFGTGSASGPSAVGAIEPQLATVFDGAQSTKSITLMMVGDMLIHTSVWNSGRRSDGTYNYDHFFANLTDEFANNDIAIVNQETILGGTEHGLEDFPNFNSPQELGDAEAKAGVDVALTATNHALDQGFEGIKWDLSYWRDKHPEMMVPGVADSQELADTIHIIERGGIKVALLNYTQHTNGIPLPDSAPWCVKKLHLSDLPGDVKRAREAGADFVIAFPHWGTEYVYTPDETQLEYGQVFLDAGVDAIIGTHPHVLENVDVRDGADGKKVPVFWSLGNFVSGQIEKPRMLGGMAKLTLEKTGDACKVTEYSLTPLVTHRAPNPSMSVYKLSDYTEELASQNAIRNAPGCGDFTLQYCYDLVAQILGEGFDANEGILKGAL